MGPFFFNGLHFGEKGAMLRSTGEKKLFYGYIVAAAGFSIWFLGWGTYNPCFSVFLKPLVAEFGWSRAAASLPHSLSYIVYALASIMMGWLTDKFGPRILIMTLGSLLGVCYLVNSQISALWQFQLNYTLLGGISVSTLSVPVMVTISRWFEKKRGLMIGIVQAGYGIGGFIFPPFAGWLILTYGWRHAYAVLGVITFLGILGAGFFLRRDPKDVGQVPDGMGETVSLEKGSPSPNRAVAELSFRKVIDTQQFWMIFGLYCCFGFCRQAFTIHLAAHVQDLGFSLRDGANVLAVLIGSSIVSRVGMGRVGDTIGNRRAFMISFAATTVSLIWGLAARDLWELYLFAFIFGFGWGNQAVLRFALTSEVFGLGSLGLIMGALGVAEAGAAAFGSYFAGYVFDMVGNYRPVFWTGIGVSMMGILLAWWLKPAVQKRQ